MKSNALSTIQDYIICNYKYKYKYKCKYKLRKLPTFRVKSVKIYPVQKKFTREFSWLS